MMPNMTEPILNKPTGLPVIKPTGLPGAKVRTYPEMFVKSPPRDLAPPEQKYRGKWTKSKRAAFLYFLKTSQNITRSCDAVGLSTAGYQALKKRSKLFAAAVQHCFDSGSDDLEDRLMHRSIYGTQKGIYHLGNLVNIETVYNDAVAFKMLASRKKDMYGAALAIDQKLHVTPLNKNTDAALKAIQDLKGKVDIGDEVD